MRLDKVMIYCSIVILGSCLSVKSNTKNYSTNDKVINSIDSLSNELFAQKHTILWNETNEFALVLTKSKHLSDLFLSVHYFVYNAKLKSVIIEDKLNQGAVKWTDKYTIKARSKKEGQHSQGFEIYTYDVEKEKIRSN